MNIEWKHLFSDITLIRETLQYKEKKDPQWQDGRADEHV